MLGLLSEAVTQTATSSTASAKFAISVFFIGASFIFPYLEKRGRLTEYTTIPILFLVIPSGLFLTVEILLIESVSATLAGVENPAAHAESTIYLIAIVVAFFTSIGLTTEEIPEMYLLDHYLVVISIATVISIFTSFQEAGMTAVRNLLVVEPIALAIYPLFLVFIPVYLWYQGMNSKAFDWLYSQAKDNLFWTILMLSILTGMTLAIL